ncbi:MAG: enoyl-CoA hydratase/isomerase family protein [Bacteroidetes bacterium]|nr:enoyl-CoA hydratase/isomerase family protein [Bacteroidota bacterium]
MQLVKTEIVNRVGYVILNRPEKRNALSPELVDELTLALQEFSENEFVKVIVLKSADKPFCAGADLSYIARMREFSHAENLADSQRLRRLFDLIYTGNKIYISMVQGPALAGGCGLATVCDFCFATPEATFGYTESKIGFVPALVMVYLQYRVSGLVLRDLLLTGRVISATEALHLGLINRLAEDTEIGKIVQDFADHLCNTVSSDSVAYIKTMLRNIPSMPVPEALDYAAETNAKARKSNDCIAGINAFLNKEKIQW